MMRVFELGLKMAFGVLGFDVRWNMGMAFYEGISWGCYE
jgi:hypothetical protein